MIEIKKNNFFLHEEVDICLNNIIKNKTFANGYIFYGAEGLGKKQTALQFIKEIFKQSSPKENVEEKITNNNHPDFLIVEPDSLYKSKNSGSSDLEKTIKSGSEIIKIAQIRNIKTFLSQKSINSEKKIVLIIDAHLLNEAASNCLLKTLEEPNNGIFILLTSKLNLLLDTIISRCQIVRFRSFSGIQIKSILKEYLDNSKLNIHTKLKFEDLINSANGSPNQLLQNIQILNDFSNEIISKMDSPIKNSLEILEISKSISEKLEIFQQICLVNLIQTIWWRKTKNIGLIKKLENLKILLRKNIQPRLAWEITFLKISMENTRG
ncbi:DNA polymerase III subunit delta' [Prochlorococcus marinus XMU1419]|uniref:DNA polymerase III subunit delta' n=1 Tax=Prochlorococcus marinus TaxID=1219 RepID=UPI001ADC1611|nr:DNA polymerase III subunit delta' [Prochlorococcus marinus]MBO8233031.1 DNA polymerase III subunit delta' [Prochlorococcus marinus XMU1419]MBW3076517.1 DNA polymerase III subunit delta' [Prochlorococcus marinus str. XMU1419]